MTVISRRAERLGTTETGSAGRWRPRGARLVRGRPGDPAWARPALAFLLIATGVLYLAGLSRNGWANDFYAAAVEAGTKSWKAFLFGSFDSSNFITVDKTPAALWVMELSARIFGLNSWSLLVPQALEGVATVGLLYAAVRRWFGAGAGLIAGAVLALTPVATLMFRFNNPDALLVLVLTGAAYATLRAVESGRTRWLALAGALLGLGFLTKMLQAFLLLPVLGLAYLVAGPPGLKRRMVQLLAGLGALVAAAGWWVAIVVLTPAADRPYVGGSTTNSILQLTFGYNGLGRLTGHETGSVGFGGSGSRAGAGPAGAAAGSAGGAVGRGGSAFGGGGSAPGGGGSAFGGKTGLTRLFSGEMGGQASWLIPAALIALAGIGGLAWHYRRRRVWRNPARRPGLVAAHSNHALQAAYEAGEMPARLRAGRLTAAALVWGGWLLVTGLVFSYMSGIIHPYYTVALAPAIGALTGIGAAELWRRRELAGARSALALMVAVTAAWAWVLLGRSSGWLPWLRGLIAVAAVAAVVLILIWPWLERSRGRLVAAVCAGLTASAAMLAGPLAYSISTAATAHAGALPSAGPAVAAAVGGPGGFAGGAGGAGAAPGGTALGRTGTASGGTGGTAGTGFAPGRTAGTGTRPGGAPGKGTLPARSGRQAGAPAGSAGSVGGPGGLAGTTQVSKAMTRLLNRGAAGYTWVAATVGSESAAPLELAADEPVMAIGGFNGSDPTPTLTAFERMVAQHKVHYFIGANQASFGGGTGSAARITSWVRAHYQRTKVGGLTVYDLSKPK